MSALKLKTALDQETERKVTGTILRLPNQRTLLPKIAPTVHHFRGRA